MRKTSFNPIAWAGAAAVALVAYYAYDAPGWGAVILFYVVLDYMHADHY